MTSQLEELIQKAKDLNRQSKEADADVEAAKKKILLDVPMGEVKVLMEKGFVDPVKFCEWTGISVDTLLQALVGKIKKIERDGDGNILEIEFNPKVKTEDKAKKAASGIKNAGAGIVAWLKKE